MTMADRRKQRTTVRFSAPLDSDHEDLGIGSRRSAWESEENFRSVEHRDQQVLPPKRPSRERGFLMQLPGELFVHESEESDREEQAPSRADHSKKSILKNSKYNTQTPPSLIPTNTSPQEYLICLNDAIPPSDESSDEESPQNSPTSLSRKHRDSVLNLSRLTSRCEMKREESALSLPSVLNIVDDEEVQSVRSDGTAAMFGMVMETDDESLGPLTYDA